MKVFVAGASGMVGTELKRRLRARGDTVIALVRRPAAGPGEVRWDPAAGMLERDRLAGADAVVNLSGASLSRLPWTSAHRRAILDSRVGATSTLAAALRDLAGAGTPVPAMVSGSAVGYYGDRRGETLDEGSSRGEGFLADVVSRWEAEALRAPDDTRVALLRTGIVLGDGGAGRILRRVARLGVAGPIGDGAQHWPWVSLRDEVAAIMHLLDSDLTGPVNAVGPAPATAAEIMRTLAAALRRPYWAPLPRPVVSAVLGEAGDELLLSDQRVLPGALVADGFSFAHSTVAEAVRAELV